MTAAHWDLDDFGRAEVVERVYASASTEVYRLRAGEVSFALKVPRSELVSGQAYEARRTVGGVSTVWDVWCAAGGDVGEHHDELPRATREELLENEAETLSAVGARWNHRVVQVSRGDLVARRGVLGLTLEWHPGLPFDALPRQRRRALLPRMMLALWDALSAGRHGDVHGGNLLVSPDGAFSLIDPGAQVWHERGPRGPSGGLDRLTFVTTASAYPILPPYHLPHRSLAACQLQEFWEEFQDSMTRRAQSPTVSLGSVEVGRIGRRGGRFLSTPAIPEGEPLPADLLAVGILYYRALTGAHPFPARARRPAWAGLRCVDDRFDPHHAPPLGLEGAPPGRLDPTITPTEETLSLALLGLQIGSRSHLAELVAAVGA